MSIQMTPNQTKKEIIRKEEIKQSRINDEPRKISHSIKPSVTAKIIKANPGNDSSDTQKVVQSNIIRPRRAFDQYVSEKPDEQKSYGHYKMVVNENGDQIIQFSDPAKIPKEKTEGATTTKDPNNSNAKNDSKDEFKIQKLKSKRQQLKQQVMSEPDPKRKEQLKKKLSQIEKKIKAQKHNF